MLQIATKEVHRTLISVNSVGYSKENSILSQGIVVNGINCLYVIKLYHVKLGKSSLIEVVENSGKLLESVNIS